MKKFVSAAAVAGLSLTGLAGAAASPALAAPGGEPAAGLAWHPCSADIVAAVKPYDALSKVKVSETIRCAELKVPLDYSRPNGTTITIEVTRTPHTGSGPAKGDLVVNPGGPGGSGAPFGARVFAQNSPAMQAAYNVIGFDPRGVGSSVPALSCDPETYNAPRPAYGTGDPKSVDVWLKRSKDYAAKCAAADKIGLLDHVTTIDSARDVESIRKALGNKKLDYYGASYGTYLGAVYATLYPDKVGKMVMDGVVGPKGVWYQANLDQDVAFDKNIDYYFGWIAKYDAIYHLGATQAEVRAFYYGLRKKLATDPVEQTLDGQEVAVGPDELDDVVQNAAYRRSQAVWGTYAAGLAAYKAGDLETFAGTFGAGTTGGADDNGWAMYLATQCTDVQWPLDWKKWQRDNDRINRRHPFLTWSNAWFNAPCLTWRGKARTPVDIGKVRNFPENILMFEATDDAATPYAGALDMQRRLPDARLVVQDGDRTHCIVHRGSAAVDAYFDAYFLTGKRPERRTVHVPQLGDPVPPGATAAARTAAKTATLPPKLDVLR
ncbi:Tripeptidyl aminopeptidase precursor [Actinomadura rubteroloni]|uniref:Tripeptidyl aminopeptidase n=1 Tax=Actinomadura rubteroloni TaxID=1926885 RepID=A0A2P4UHE9_9ACTN|nr:alpha/beta hydrolase [Actinomadura rubteroloni]POM24484.1 Tripeptidyl aminopeptidase precursor [Actinomadura rubteroloni]